MLTRAQRARWRDQGFLVLPGFKSEAEVVALRRRAGEIVEAFDPRGRASRFDTRAQPRSADAQFLRSAEGVHCFFETEALDADGKLLRPKNEAVNKIGHALHDLDPVFDRFSRGPRMDELARELGLREPQAWQSMLIAKPPAIGGEVRWHQDASFLITDPPSVVGFWFALDEATQDNGCLWVQPGGHRGPLRELFLRTGDTLQLQSLDPAPWPALDQALPLPAAPGTLVCLHGLLPHFSSANRSNQPRQAYTLHVTDALCAWSPANWLRRSTALPVRGLN